jgi:predicted ATPase/class 3 adenylate cyclase/Tfp pilus assembly protein PilF
VPWPGAPRIDLTTRMSEVHALLLTDIVDSTQLAETIGDAAAAALGAAHDRMARDLLRAWSGREIDKTDGMLMLFDSAADAAAFAVAYHAALALLPVPLKARAGLHVGALILRANPPQDVARGAKPLEVEGIAKPVAARIMSLALGGQTLLSAEARAALGPSALRVQSHGHWRIKGVAEPVELFELGDTSAPFTPPPDSAKVYRVVRSGELWLPLRELRHSLPAERDAFVGRHDVLLDLARRFEAGARLVSVLGIGGTGKTRLATRFAWTWLGDFPGGTWFCDLAQASNVDGIVHAVAQCLDVPLGIDDPVVQLGHAIAARGPCLLILDNFEQVARHAQSTLGRWLDRAPEARFLVTTREVLGLPGEEALALAPLGPADAAALFTRRAASARRDFKPAAEDAATIPQLVRLLDGLPLAIELAAARVRVMSPAVLLARMDQRFKLLVAAGGRRDRQATLRAAFDWSWELLSDAEKAALAQLSVFEGGFTLEAVESVLDLSGCEGSHWPVDVLQSLVDKSFVRRAQGERFDLLNSVQDYAAEQLRTVTAAKGRGEAVRGRAERAHCAYFAALHTDVAIDIDNLVLACRRSVHIADAGLAAAVLENTWAVLELRGPFRLGVNLADAVLPLPADPADHARILRVAGLAALACGMRARARLHFESAASAALVAQHPIARAYAECHLGSLLADEGLLAEARSLHQRALSAARDAGDAELLCLIGNAVATRLMDHGELDQARPCFEEALQVARRSGKLRWEGGLLGNLGNLEAELGRPDEAGARYAAALAVARRVGDLKFTGNTLSNIGLLNHQLGRHDVAKTHFDEALAIARQIGHVRLEAVVLCNLGIYFDAIDQPEQASPHFDQSLSISRELNDRRSQGQALGYLGLMHARMRDFAAARRCMNEGESLLREAADPVSLALLLCARAEAEHMAAQPAAAALHLAEADSLALAAGAGGESELGMALARARRALSDAGAAPATAPTGC